jgi:CheY-like chemotaxis protein
MCIRDSINIDLQTFIFKGDLVMPKTVLIVEDYDDARSFMKYLVESYGYDVIEASDGIEALDKFKQFHPDLIL